MNGELVLAAGAALSSTAFSVFGYRRIRSAQLVAAGETDPRAWSVWRAAVRPLARVLEARGGKDLAKTIERLQPAGRRARCEVARFAEERAFGLLLGLAFGALLGYWVSGPRGLLVFVACAAMGFVAPGMFLDAKAGERRSKIDNALPSAVD